MMLMFTNNANQLRFTHFVCLVTKRTFSVTLLVW